MGMEGGSLSIVCLSRADRRQWLQVSHCIRRVARLCSLRLVVVRGHDHVSGVGRPVIRGIVRTSRMALTGDFSNLFLLQ